MDIKKNPYFRANLSKSGFNCSAVKQFSTIVGFLQPFLTDVLSPGESVQLNDNVFMRSEVMTTSPFTRIRFKAEYFFVPFPQLWSFFGSMYYGIKDFHSSSLNPDLVDGFNSYPHVSSQVLLDFLDDKTGEVDFHDVDFSSGVRRLLDGFNQYPKYKYVSGSESPVDRLYPFYFAQAYQRIFDTFYRNDIYEPHDRLSYNVDDIQSGYYAQPTQDFTRLVKLFQPRYRPMPRDLFSNVQPSPVFNVYSIDAFRAGLGTTGSALVGGKQLYYSDKEGQELISFQDQRDVATIGIESTGSDDKFLSANAIRNLFAVEKLLAITQRTKKQYDSQTLAHFGYDVPEDVANKVFYIGSHEGVVQISDVNATATTSGEDASLLGQVAGKGVGVSGNNKDLRFRAPWHGVLMGIFSVYNDVIYPDYVQTDLVSMIDRNDFYHPEFDRLGQVPVRGINYAELPFNNDLANRVLAWNYRYSHLKMGVDRCWGNFMSTNRNWTSKRLMFDNQIGNSSIPLSFFYYSPKSLDDILLVPFNERNDFTHAYDTDPFDVEIDYKYFKSSTMSVYGLPQL